MKKVLIQINSENISEVASGSATVEGYQNLLGIIIDMANEVLVEVHSVHMRITSYVNIGQKL